MQLLYDLSIAQTQAPARRQQGEAKPGALPSLEGRRILIAEDVETNQMLLQTVLAPTGAEVEVVADGATVVKRQAEAPADLILMDLQMPGMGGIEAMRRLRAMGGAAAEIPVMALTAYVRSADRKVAMEAGMNAFLAKPIVVAELYDLLHQLLPEK
jgi:CheY-like chemotaxis protein